MMKKLYEEPEIEVRNYTLPPSDVVTTSDLNDGDDYEYNSDNTNNYLT